MPEPLHSCQPPLPHPPLHQAPEVDRPGDAAHLDFGRELQPGDCQVVGKVQERAAGQNHDDPSQGSRLAFPSRAPPQRELHHTHQEIQNQAGSHRRIGAAGKFTHEEEKVRSTTERHSPAPVHRHATTTTSANGPTHVSQPAI